MHDILIVGKQNKFGLSKDIEFLRKALSDSDPYAVIGTAGIRERSVLQRLTSKKAAKTIIHIERVFPSWFSAAEKHILIPNQERFPKRHLGRLKNIDLVLAKTRHAEEIFKAHGVKTEYVGFESEDRFDPTVEKDWNRFFHLAGGSTLKGTDEILSLWEKHPEWPELVLVQKTPTWKNPFPANVTVKSGYMDDAELKRLQNTCGIHLCPSLSEGWGHHIVEAMSTESLVLTTDAPPMNEHINENNGVLVPYAKTQPRHLGTCYFVDIDALEKTIHALINTPTQGKIEKGRAARKGYEGIKAVFHMQINSLLGNQYIQLEADTKRRVSR